MPRIAAIDAFRIAINAEDLVEETRQLLSESNLFYLTFPEIPTELALNRSASYHDEVIPGRSEPIVSWLSAGAPQITFTVKLMATGDSNPEERTPSGPGRFARELPFAPPVTLRQFDNDPRAPDLIQGGGGSPGVLHAEVRNKANWLLALTSPQYQAGRAYPPPTVTLAYGANWWKRGVVRDVSLTYQGPWDPVTLMCYRIDASITFQEVNHTPPGFRDTLRGVSPQWLATTEQVRRASAAALGFRSVDAARRQQT